LVSTPLPPPPPELFTVSEPAAVCEPLVAVPFTVKVLAPVVALALAVRVNVALPPAVTEAGLNEPVTPEGRPLTLKETLCAEPEVTAVFTVTVVELPWVTLALPEASDTAKSLVWVWVEYEPTSDTPEKEA
jgi:hypothetical protein